MNNKIEINGHELIMIRVGENGYKISVFLNGKAVFHFTVSLQPSGKDNVLSSYQISDKSKEIPAWIYKNLDAISDWIIKVTE